MRYYEGQKIVMNKLANYEYGITKEGWQGIIIKVYDENTVKVESLDGCNRYTIESKFMNPIQRNFNELVVAHGKV